MNEAIIAQHAQAHKLITESLGLPALDELSSIDEENERRYSDDEYREYRVPVTIVQKALGAETVRDLFRKRAKGIHVVQFHRGSYFSKATAHPGRPIATTSRL